MVRAKQNKKLRLGCANTCFEKIMDNGLWADLKMI